jgi:hypothetical protein
MPQEDDFSRDTPYSEPPSSVSEHKADDERSHDDDASHANESISLDGSDDWLEDGALEPEQGTAAWAKDEAGGHHRRGQIVVEAHDDAEHVKEHELHEKVDHFWEDEDVLAYSNVVRMCLAGDVGSLEEGVKFANKYRRAHEITDEQHVAVIDRAGQG